MSDSKTDRPDFFWRKPADRPMYTVAYMVVMRVPTSMNPSQVKSDLERNVGFGHPEITLQWVCPEGSPNIDAALPDTASGG